MYKNRLHTIFFEVDAKVESRFGWICFCDSCVCSVKQGSLKNAVYNTLCFNCKVKQCYSFQN